MHTFSFSLSLLYLQARPELEQQEEMEEEEEEEEKEVDLSVPGSSYIKLMLLTPPPILPGTVFMKLIHFQSYFYIIILLASRFQNLVLK